MGRTKRARSTDTFIRQAENQEEGGNVRSTVRSMDRHNSYHFEVIIYLTAVRPQIYIRLI